MTKEVKCPKCGFVGEAISIEYGDKKVIFDACIKCGTKLTEWTEE